MGARGGPGPRSGLPRGGWLIAQLAVLGFLAGFAGHRGSELARLRALVDRQRRLIELAPEAIVVEARGRIVFANPAALALLDLERSAADDSGGLLALVTPADREAAARELADLAARDDAVGTLECRMRGRTGPIEAEARVIRFALDGEPAVLALVRDVSCRHQAIIQLARQQAELEKGREVSRLKDHFISTISHEMKTPLSLIIGYAELIEEKYPNEPLVAGIVDGARRLTEHVERMLDYAALAGRTMPLYRIPTDVDELVRQAAAAEAPAFEASGVRFTSEIAPDLPIAELDGRRLYKALLELLGNARRFTPRGRRAGIRACAIPGGVRIEIWDEGDGLAPADAARVWDPFVQLGIGDAERSGGLGIGLSIVKLVVELHGGHVGLESAIGRGCRVWLDLPLASPPGFAGDGG